MRRNQASWTARWVATQRAALHDERPRRGDSCAELRLDRDLALPLLGVRMAGPTGMAARTRFMDDQLLDAVGRGVTQIGIIGAGYDGRPLRFSELPVRWIEVDHPATQADKRARLERIQAEIGHVTFVAANLLEDDLGEKLATAGHDPARPSLWICEGLFPYLPSQSITDLCRTLRDRSSPTSALIGNVLVNDAPRPLARFVRRGVEGLLAAIGERRLSEFTPGDIEGLLTASGWHVNVVESTSPGRADGTYLLAIAAAPAG